MINAFPVFDSLFQTQSELFNLLSRELADYESYTVDKPLILKAVVSLPRHCAVPVSALLYISMNCVHTHALC